MWIWGPGCKSPQTAPNPPNCLSKIIILTADCRARAQYNPACTSHAYNTVLFVKETEQNEENPNGDNRTGEAAGVTQPLPKFSTQLRLTHELWGASEIQLKKHILSVSVYSCTGSKFSQSLCTAVQEVSSLRVCVQLYRKCFLRVCVQLYRKYVSSESVYSCTGSKFSQTLCTAVQEVHSSEAMYSSTRSMFSQSLCTAVQEVCFLRVCVQLYM